MSDLKRCLCSFLQSQILFALLLLHKLAPLVKTFNYPPFINLSFALYLFLSFSLASNFPKAPDRYAGTDHVFECIGLLEMFLSSLLKVQLPLLIARP